MARFSVLYLGDELTKLRDGFEVMERVVDLESLESLNLWLYSIVTDDYILDIAKEAISSEYDDNDVLSVSENDIELKEIAIALPVTSSSIIDKLHGRGVSLGNVIFAYQVGEGEGVRTERFIEAPSETAAVLTTTKMKTRALAIDKSELNGFLQEFGSGQEMRLDKKVQRNEEATVNAPHVPEPSKPRTPKPPRKASSSGGAALLDIVEDFLG